MYMYVVFVRYFSLRTCKPDMTDWLDKMGLIEQEQIKICMVLFYIRRIVSQYY